MDRNEFHFDLSFFRGSLIGLTIPIMVPSLVTLFSHSPVFESSGGAAGELESFQMDN